MAALEIGRHCTCGCCDTNRNREEAIFLKRDLGRLVVLGLQIVALGVVGASARSYGANLIATATAASVSQTFADMRVRELIGSEVRTPQGSVLGKIDDLIIDANNDRVYYAVLSLGGLMGFGDRLSAFPVQMFTPAASGNRLNLIVDTTTLKTIPALDGRRNSEWAVGHGDIKRFAAPPNASPMPNQLLRRASELVGTNVDDRTGAHIGKISDLVVNIGRGAVRYAALELDRPANVNRTAALIPLGIFDFPADRGNTAIINVERSRLDTALTFDKNRWPLINSHLFLVEIERHLIAADPKHDRAVRNAHAVFDRLDDNRDNKLSAAEARRDSMVLDLWPRMDPAGAGQVTRAEFAARFKAIAD